MAVLNYELNKGQWAPKDEVKVSFYTELFNFVKAKNNNDLDGVELADFITFEPYIIGNMLGKYFLKEEVGGVVENQPDDFFIGYLFKNKKFLELIPHLEIFFALWRDIEGCREENATDFYASSWASLVDTAKFFKYTTVEDLENSNESPTVRDKRILDSIQNCPGRYFAPTESSTTEDLRLPVPKRQGYEFAGWYLDKDFKGEVVTHASKDITAETTFYARWATHTFFHSNDGYPTFENIYADFLNDFSTHLGKTVTDFKERVGNHGWVTEFVKESFDGKMNSFFNVEEYRNKWQWLVDYLISLKRDPSVKELFFFKNGKFNSENHVRWELNSLFSGRFHLVWPKTGDYSGVGIKEKIADNTNTAIIKVKYLVNDEVQFPVIERDGFKFLGYFDNPRGEGESITKINNDLYAAKVVYAKWK